MHNPYVFIGLYLFGVLLGIVAGYLMAPRPKKVGHRYVDPRSDISQNITSNRIQNGKKNIPVKAFTRRPSYRYRAQKNKAV